MRHGAKVKRCSSEGCTNVAQIGGVCIRHGARHKRCSITGCTNQTLKEEYARGMGQRLRSNYAAMKDVQIKSSVKECASDMGQRSNNAATKAAQNMSTGEECARGTGQSAIYAVVKDAQIRLRKEECV